MFKKTVTTTTEMKQIIYASTEGFFGREARFTLEICFMKPHGRRVAVSTVTLHPLDARQNARELWSDRVLRSPGTAHSARTNDEIEAESLFEFGRIVQRELDRIKARAASVPAALL